jgi:ribosomal protein S18 acetylase RimI-like enzyme
MWRDVHSAARAGGADTCVSLESLGNFLVTARVLPILPLEKFTSLLKDAANHLKRASHLASIRTMNTILIEIRQAKPCDAGAVADAHDDAWRAAYQGIIPGVELEKLVSRRGPDWWDSAIRKGSRISVLVFGERVAGYANYGRNRARSLSYDGEVYELYLRPEFQGLGFGRRLFTAARKDLANSGLRSLVIWALSDNDPAVAFYRALGGRPVARSSERFGGRTLDKVAFGWQS